MRNRGWPVYRF